MTQHGRISAESRLQRLLVMIPWIMANEGPEVEDVCQRFGTTEDDLANDLELLFLCGLYPFTPDTLIEADILDGRVWIRSADQFQRPPKLTAEEALALLAAASTVADLEGNEENTVLKNALAKLSGALGIEGEGAVEVELAPTAPQVLETVRAAQERQLVLEVDYYSYGRDAWSRRRIEPYQIFNSEGNWYSQGRAVEKDEIRNFRIDRMRSPIVTQIGFPLPRDLPEVQVYRARSTDPEVTLDLDDSGLWMLDQYPLTDTEKLGDGKTRVTLRVSETLWLQRLLLRLGPSATVVAGDFDVEGSARQILTRYERQS